MSDVEDFPTDYYHKLEKQARDRVARSAPGKEFCSLMNLIVSSSPLENEQIAPWLAAMASVPGFEHTAGRYLHELAHRAFELGRQYEMQIRDDTDMSDVTIDDFKS